MLQSNVWTILSEAVASLSKLDDNFGPTYTIPLLKDVNLGKLEVIARAYDQVILAGDRFFVTEVNEAISDADIGGSFSEPCIIRVRNEKAHETEQKYQLVVRNGYGGLMLIEPADQAAVDSLRDIFEKYEFVGQYVSLNPEGALAKEIKKDRGSLKVEFSDWIILSYREEKLAIISGLANLSLETLKYLAESNNFFVSNNQLKHKECLEIINAIAALPSAGQHEITRCVNDLLIKKVWYGDLRAPRCVVELINVLNGLPEGRLRAVVDRTMTLDSIGQWEAQQMPAEVIKKIGFFKDEHLEALTKTYRHVCSFDKEEKGHYAEIFALAEVPFAHWQQLHRVSEQITAQHQWDEKVGTEVLTALATVPVSHWAGVVEGSLASLKHGKCDSVVFCNSLRRLSNRTIASEKVAVLLSQVMKLFNGKALWKKSDYDCGNVLHTLNKIPLDNLDFITDSVIAILSGSDNWNQELNECSFLLSEMRKIPIDEISEAIRVAQLISNGKAIEYYGILIAAAHNIPDNYVKGAVRIVREASETSSNWDGEQYEKLLKTICKIPSKFEFRLIQAKAGVTEIGEGTGYAQPSIIRVLNRNGAFDYTIVMNDKSGRLKHFTAPEHLQVPLRDIFIVAGSIKRVVLQEDHPVVQEVVQRGGSSTPDDRIDALSPTILKLAARIRESGNEINGYEYSHVIEQAIKLGDNQSGEVLNSHARVSKGRELSTWESQQLMNALCKVDQDQMAVVLDGFDYVDHRLKIKGSEADDVIRALSGIPESRIRSLIDTAFRFGQNEKWSAYDLTRVLTCLKDLHEGQLSEEHIQAILGLAGSQGIDGHTFRNLIEETVLVSPDKLDRVMAGAAQIRDTQKDKGCLPDVISEIKLVPDDKLDQIVRGLVPILKNNDRDKIKIADVIRRITPLPVDHIVEALNAAQAVYGALEYDGLVALTTFMRYDAPKTRELMEELRPFLPYPYQLMELVRSMPFISDVHLTSALKPIYEEISNYIREYQETYDRTPWSTFTRVSFRSVLMRYILAMGIAGPDRRDEVIAHWTNVLQSDDHYLVQELLNVILQYTTELGFREHEPLVQLAIRVETVMSGGDSKNPYNIHARLLAKRSEAIVWSQIPTLQCILENRCIRFSPEKLWNFSNALEPNYESVPRYTPTNFQELLNQLKHKLKSDDFHEKVTGIGDVLELTNAALKADSELQLLLLSPLNNRTSAYLKCLLNHYETMQDPEEKYVALASFLASVRGCRAGKESAIEEIYFGLPAAARMQDKLEGLGIRQKTIKALSVLGQAIQKTAMSQFSDGSIFVNRACGIGDNDHPQQASHQVQVLRGLIGDKVGLPSTLKFDLHSGLIYESLLKVSCQELIGLYYRDLKLEQVIPVLRNSINEEVLYRKSVDPDLYRSFAEVFGQNCEASIDMSFKSEDDLTGEFVGVTNLGVINMLKHADVIEELDKLPL